ncbi:MAG: BatA domain-containing protein [Planctomycetota bacterium]
MSFLHPLLLSVGLGAIAIPIAIHLLMRRRRKPVAWAAMRFLLEAYRQQQRRIQLEQWLLLFMRCLLIALIALAIARPGLEEGGLIGASGRDVYLVIDDSAVSQVRLDEGGTTAFDRSVEAARAILETLDPGDRVGLALASKPVRSVVVPASNDVGAVRRLLDELEPTEAPADLSGALEALSAKVIPSMEDGRSVQVAVLSEFRSGSAETPTPIRASFSGVDGIELVASQPATQTVEDVSIMEASALRRLVLQGSALVRVTLRRSIESSMHAGISTVIATVGDSPLPAVSREVRFEPGQREITLTLDVAVDTADEELEVITVAIDRDAFQPGNTRHVVVSVEGSLGVGMIAEQGITSNAIDEWPAARWIRFALTADAQSASELTVTTLDPSRLDRSVLDAVGVIIVTRPDRLDSQGWGSIERFASGGGVVFVMPAGDQLVQSWTDRVTEMTGGVIVIDRETHDLEEPIALSLPETESGLFAMTRSELPALLERVSVQKLLRMRSSEHDASGILLRAGEQVAAMSASVGRGRLICFAFSPEVAWTDLPVRPAFVVIMQELIREGGADGIQGYETWTGEAAVAPARAVRLGRGDERIEVTEDGLAANALRRSGVLDAYDAGNRSVGVVATNIAPVALSLETVESQAVQEWLSGAFASEDADMEEPAVRLVDDFSVTAPSGSGDSTKLSMLLFALAAMVAVVELAMARFFSHSSSSRSTPEAGL